MAKKRREPGRYSLAELHERIVSAHCQLQDFRQPGKAGANVPDDKLINGTFTITDPDAEQPEDAEVLAEFRKAWVAALDAVCELDSLFHDLWDCP